MDITSAVFVKGVVGDTETLQDGIPQIAFIGRSNVGKSSIINALTKQPKLARSSNMPGRTKEINVFMINKSFYLLDLPGYGFAKASLEIREKIQKLIFWYLLNKRFDQRKVVLVIDARIGTSPTDLDMLNCLVKQRKSFIVLVNKVDKLRKSEYQNQIKKIQETFAPHKVILFSAEKKLGIKELNRAVFSAQN